MQCVNTQAELLDQGAELQQIKSLGDFMGNVYAGTSLGILGPDKIVFLPSEKSFEW